MKTAMKPLALHRLSITLLTCVLLLCACVGQQRDIQHLCAQRELAREKQIKGWLFEWGGYNGTRLVLT